MDKKTEVELQDEMNRLAAQHEKIMDALTLEGLSRSSIRNLEKQLDVLEAKMGGIEYQLGEIAK